VITDLIHVGAVLAFGGFAGTFWAGVRTQRAWILLPCYVFLIAAAFAAGYQ
jgi:hypothetical protein